MDSIVTSEPRRRWLAIGTSSDASPRRAGTVAAGEALAGTDAKLLIVFASHGYDMPELVAGIHERSGGGVPLIGCSTAGEIATGGPRDGSVAVVALGGPGFTVSTGVARESSRRLRAAGSEAAACVPTRRTAPHAVLMLLTAGLGGDQQEIVRGAHAVAGAAVPLVGGCAGDDLRMDSTCQVHGHEVLRDAVVAAHIASDAPLGIGVHHGWRKLGEPVLVTRSFGNRVYTLDERPALDVYLDRLEAPRAAHSEAAAFTRFALTHPLGLSRRGAEARVRFVGEADFIERWLGCIAAVPQGALAWFMEGDHDSVLHASDAACQEALAPLGEAPPLGLIVFDCIARRGVLGDAGIKTEIDRIARGARGAPVAGFYTYGEIARTRGVSGFHNQTLVALAVG